VINKSTIRFSSAALEKQKINHKKRSRSSGYTSDQ